MISSITNADQLRKMLTMCETEIEKLACIFYKGQDYYCNSNNQEIMKKLDERAKLLNRLFELHFNDDDLVRLSKVNSLLETYEHDLEAEHARMYAMLQAIDKRYLFCSLIEYWHDDKTHNWNLWTMMLFMDPDGIECWTLSTISTCMIAFCMIVTMKVTHLILMAGENTTMHLFQWHPKSSHAILFGT